MTTIQAVMPPLIPSRSQEPTLLKHSSYLRTDVECIFTFPILGSLELHEKFFFYLFVCLREREIFHLLAVLQMMAMGGDRAGRS